MNFMVFSVAFLLRAWGPSGLYINIIVNNPYLPGLTVKQAVFIKFMGQWHAAARAWETGKKVSHPNYYLIVFSYLHEDISWIIVPDWLKE
ncbi:hypothetical protein [Desulfobacter vibrioformis]|uniref:hypothetical protein n=1 Tax=Desulfobacter vibrioformis TaxID=34031 RepID=UPI0012EC0BC2|nr:hypothetical protein [Desulfobacter vibrioformis]